ncbi:MAG: hypothetical protein IPM51_11275 [Sphingobacteriaceae bacterium]|nr:hypothetical protein [Sphingobacteriaceae bacterium]
MKSSIIPSKKALIIAFLFCGFIALSQTREQARTFVSRSHIALAKIEKEMYYSKNTQFESQLKKAIKYQLTAVKLYKENKYSDAVGYSYKSRSLSMEICKDMNISEGTWYNLNDEEKVYCDPAKYVSGDFNFNILNADQIKLIDELDLLNPQKFHEIELGNLK